jgi:hypothetical protein
MVESDRKTQRRVVAMGHPRSGGQAEERRASGRADARDRAEEGEAGWRADADDRGGGARAGTLEEVACGKRVTGTGGVEPGTVRDEIGG